MVSQKRLGLINNLIVRQLSNFTWRRLQMRAAGLEVR
jgi:hypothetical protein